MSLAERIRYHETELRRLRKLRRKERGFTPRQGRGCRADLRDDEEKARRGYTDPRSYVRRDGSEVLKGEDWQRRVAELAERSGGRCEEEIVRADNPRMPLWCINVARDPHHKIKRSLYRDDRLTNLAHLCGWHHDEKDGRKPRFSARGSKAAD